VQSPRNPRAIKPRPWWHHRVRLARTGCGFGPLVRRLHAEVTRWV